MKLRREVGFDRPKLGTATEGTLEAVDRGAHPGRTTQAGVAEAGEVAAGRTPAPLRCRPMVLWPKH